MAVRGLDIRGVTARMTVDGHADAVCRIHEHMAAIAAAARETYRSWVSDGGTRRL